MAELVLGYLGIALGAAIYSERPIAALQLAPQLVGRNWIKRMVESALLIVKKQKPVPIAKLSSEHLCL